MYDEAEVIHTFVDNHRISEQPCATRAAMELLPRSKPSTIPAAIASTFFSAPAISTPVTSLYHEELQTGDATATINRKGFLFHNVKLNCYDYYTTKCRKSIKSC